MNKAYERMTGFACNKVVGTTTQNMLGSDSAVINRLRRKFAEQEEFSFRQISRTARGVEFIQIISFAPVYDEEERCVAYVGLHEDVTEKMFRDAAEREREKLVSLGNMAGGIAHELNNILHPILNFTKVSRKVMRINLDEADGYLDIVQKSAIKAGVIVHKVLAYVRRDLEQPIATTIAESLQDALELANTRVPPGIALQVDTATLGNEQVIIGKTELTQIVMNLVVNAVQAMGQHGKLQITGHVETLPEPLVGKVLLAPGCYVKLALTDTGFVHHGFCKFGTP
ncbi:MAG: PAS domain S-box protein [Rhodospirillaceae bacterium]